MVPQGLHQASSHLQQLQAHLLRTSPYLSPQNSFIHAASYLPPPVALFGAASTSGKENIIEIEFIHGSIQISKLNLLKTVFFSS